VFRIRILGTAPEGGREYGWIWCFDEQSELAALIENRSKGGRNIMSSKQRSAFRIAAVNAWTGERREPATLTNGRGVASSSIHRLFCRLVEDLAALPVRARGGNRRNGRLKNTFINGQGHPFSIFMQMP
jgi:hypothetical protein